MSNSLIDKNYILKIYQHTKNYEYVKIAKEISEFVQEIYRSIEPSHYNGEIIIFKYMEGSFSFEEDTKEEFYDKGILNHDYESLIFQLRNEDKSPLIWKNVANDAVSNLLEIENDFIAYVYKDNEECFIVNKQQIPIINRYSCPSIFALQYHDLNAALLDYKNERVRTVTGELVKDCWADDKWIYLKNKPEESMQISIKEYLEDRIRGVNIVREYVLGASKPVDVRVYWREANRASLIELKWMGQSLAVDGNVGVPYSNSRANDGMEQIKEYIDLERGDTPSIITKGYLVVIDGRRKNIATNKVDSISRDDGMHYASKELEIDGDKKYWDSSPNIEKPIRMFVEPICGC